MIGVSLLSFIYAGFRLRNVLQVPSSAQLKMKMTQISSGSFFILEPADEFLETQWFQGLACRLGRLAACRPLDDARPIFRKSFRGLREIQKKSSDECLHSRRTLFLYLLARRGLAMSEARSA